MHSPVYGYPHDFCRFRGLISSHRPYTQLLTGKFFHIYNVKDDSDVMCVVYVLPEVGMLTTIVYKLTGKCKNHMKNEKLSELQQLICPPSKKEANPCRYEMHAICAEHAENVSQNYNRKYHFQVVREIFMPYCILNMPAKKL